MLIELPIQLVNRKESEIVGSDSAETMDAVLTIKIDCIQAIHRDIETRSILETNTGSTYLILLPYNVLKLVWQRALDTMKGPFIIQGPPPYDEKMVKPQKTDVVKDDDVEIVCENCGGLNFDDYGEQNSPEGKVIIKKCRDCGVIQSFK
jgi:hypothetical protein